MEFATVHGDWIKVHRRMLDHPVMQHDGLCRLWMYCLMRANWKESNWLIPGTTKRIKIPRGGFVTGRKILHQTLYSGNKIGDPSAITLWRWLLSLEEIGCLKIENMNNRCSLVTICKYTTYQDAKDTGEQPVKRQNSEHSLSNTKTSSETGRNVNNRKQHLNQSGEATYGNYQEPLCTTDEQPVNSRRTTGEQPVNTEEEGKKVRREEFSLSLTLPDGEFEFPQRWQVPSLIRAIGNWAAHIQAQGKSFQRMHLNALLAHHASAGWSAERLERGINLSLSKSTQTTILDPDEADRPRIATGTGGRPQKDYTP